MNIEVAPERTLDRVARLREHTHASHERLDARIMASEPFKDLERYGRFVQMQYIFHRDVDALYGDATLAEMLPDLSTRRRLGLIGHDLTDLGLDAPITDSAPIFDVNTVVDVPTALGWLYVVEGSNLGAAFLLKEAARLDLNENFGARHLAAAPEGRGLNWRRFTSAVNAATLCADEDIRATNGANDAFARVRTLVERLLPIST